MRYRVGDLELALQGFSLPLEQDNMIVKFTSDRLDAPDISYREAVIDEQIIAQSKVLQYTGGYELLQSERGLFLLNHWAQCRTAYGIWLDELDGETPIYMSPKMADQKPISISYLLSTVGLHRKLLRNHCVLLHASYIEFQGKAILFLGPSGTGKSTQADLWHQYACAPILNGDRVLLRQKDGSWYVYGYPCCGSSSICVNRTLELGAIVVLQQAPENRVEELSAARRICALTTASEFYPWDQWEVDVVFAFAEQLAGQTMLRLSCRADQEAVNVLRNYLEAKL